LNYPLHSPNVNRLRCSLISLMKIRDYVQRNQHLRIQEDVQKQ
jgi:hypothetical protein